MYSHAPKDYQCPFCLIASGGGNSITSQQDVFYKSSLLTAFIAAKWWKNNPGHVIIITNKHFENIYELPDDYAHEVTDFTKEVAIALKKIYACDGVSLRQHNEPAGGQDVFHYHMHVIPRYYEDNLYLNDKEFAWVDQKDRLPYAEKMRKYFKEHA